MYSNYADKVDDSDGHGTHVSCTAIGQSYYNYGDYRKYQGRLTAHFDES
jgi:hypothetical protein